jgi:hypothetical protein
MVVNFREEVLTVPKGTVLGIAQEMSESLVVPLDEGVSTVKNANRVLFSESSQKVTRKFKEYIATKLAHLSKTESKIIEPVLWEYSDLFHDDEDNDFKSTCG